MFKVAFACSDHSYDRLCKALKDVSCVDASTWTSNKPQAPALIPIGGAGQVNGAFVLDNDYGIQLGIRAQTRYVGPAPCKPNQGQNTGLYSAQASPAGQMSLWNFDWTVDLRNAEGPAKDVTLGDFELTLQSDISDTLFGLPNPYDLAKLAVVNGTRPGPDTLLYQESFNPSFGTVDFDATATGRYDFVLQLKQKKNAALVPGLKTLELPTSRQ